MKLLKGIFILLIGINHLAKAGGHVQPLPAPVFISAAAPQVRAVPQPNPYPYYEAKRRIQDIYYYRNWTDAQKVSATKEQVIGFVMQYAKQKLKPEDFQQLESQVKDIRQPEYQNAENPSPNSNPRLQPKGLFEESVQVADTVPGGGDDYAQTQLVKQYMRNMK